MLYVAMVEIIFTFRFRSSKNAVELCEAAEDRQAGMLNGISDFVP